MVVLLVALGLWATRGKGHLDVHLVSSVGLCPLTLFLNADGPGRPAA